MNGLLRMLLSPVAGFGAYQAVQLVSQMAAFAAGATVMLAFALLPGRQPGFAQD